MSEYRSQQPVSGWASGGVVFAGVMLVLIGCFQSIVGLTAIFNDDFFASRVELHVRPRSERVGLDPSV